MAERDDSGAESGAMLEGGIDRRGDYGFDDCGVRLDDYEVEDEPNSRDGTIDPYLDDALDSVSDAILDLLGEPGISRKDLIRIVHFDDIGRFDVDLGLIYPISGDVPGGARLTYAIDVDNIAGYEEADYSDTDEEALLAYIEESLDAFKGLALAELTPDQKYLLYQYFELGGEFTVESNREIYRGEASIVFYVDFPNATQAVED